MADLELIRGNDKFPAVPEAGGGLHGGYVCHCRCQENHPSACLIYQFVVLHPVIEQGLIVVIEPPDWPVLHFAIELGLISVIIR